MSTRFLISIVMLVASGRSNATELEFVSDVVNVGDFQIGSKDSISGEFQLANQSDKPVEIVDVRVSGRHVTLAEHAARVAPGEKEAIKLTLSPATKPYHFYGPDETRELVLSYQYPGEPKREVAGIIRCARSIPSLPNQNI